VAQEVIAPTQYKPGLSAILFRVIRSYKGSVDESVEIYDVGAGTDCGFSPPLGEKYLVYGFQSKDGKLFHLACSRTAPLKFAGADIRFARGEPAEQEDDIPQGEKWRLHRDPSLTTRGATVRGTVNRPGPGDLSNVFLTVWDVDERGRRENSMAAIQRVNADGSYEIRFLAPGHYKVTAEDLATQAQRLVGEFGNISLTERQILSEVNVVLQPEPLGSVAVRVIAPTTLHDRISVWLRDVEMDSVGTKPYHYAMTAHLDSQSVAHFEYVPHGRYDIFVSLEEEDLTRPSWTHDPTQVELTDDKAAAIVMMHRANSY
jgi:hypothetical protein